MNVSERSGLPDWLPAPLRRPDGAWRSIATGWLFTFVPSLLLSWLAQTLVPGVRQPEFDANGPLALFLLIVFAPVVETLIMAGVLAILLRTVPPIVAILLSSLGWGLAHSSMAAAWGLVIWWPFLIFSTLYVAWRPRGFWPAVGVVAATHALHNLVPALLVAFAA